jgi:hypothetical protein
MPHQENKYLFQIIIHEHDCMVILPSIEFEYSEYFVFLEFLQKQVLLCSNYISTKEKISIFDIVED